MLSYAPTPGQGNGKAPSARTLAREAFFLEFAKAIRSEFPTTPLMVTGGFRTRQGMRAALQDNACDIIGLARPAVLYPALPKDTVLNSEVPDEEARLVTKSYAPSWTSKLLGMRSANAGADTVSVKSSFTDLLLLSFWIITGLIMFLQNSYGMAT